MRAVRLLVALSLSAAAGGGCGGPSPAPVWVDADAPAVPADKLAGLTGGETLGELVRRLGPAHGDRGSGLHVLVWHAADGRRYRASVAALEQSVRPLGAGFDGP